jgi:biopolymer transport protein ExbD
MAVSQAIKRQRQKRRVDTDGDPEFQVAPMVDVLLVLMLFFMAITSTEVLKKDPNLHLPDANHAKPDDKNPNKKNQIVVNVSWDQHVASFTVDGVRYATADDLTGVLAQRYKQNPRAYVLIRADQDVEYSNVADVMTSCASAGIGTVSFAVVMGAPKGGPKVNTADSK